MLDYYYKLTSKCEKLFNTLLENRLKRGKESDIRLSERKGRSTLPRPTGTLIWIHAASVGEAQSTLILIDTISKQQADIKFLVTSGTLTSAQLMADRLPENAFHQFYPLDYPDWTNSFLNHWKPDLILWMESELWPNMLMQIKNRNIPSILVNARLSKKSYHAWKLFSGSAKKILSTFTLILTQTKTDELRFKNLGAKKVITTDNLKYSAAPLPYSDKELQNIQNIIKNRPTWVFASTHDGEEFLACKIHDILVKKMPDLLTIIVPRHPERRDDIRKTCRAMNLPHTFRSDNTNNQKTPPEANTQIYVADTLGELGLFYKLTDIAVIGRSFSNDGGGGHNPIEAAQLGCAVLTGPNIQFQQQLFDEMFAANAAHQVRDKSDLLKQLQTLLTDAATRTKAITHAIEFSKTKTGVIDRVMENLTPLLTPLTNKERSDAA